MVMTDPIADMLTRVRNANSVYHSKVEIPASKIKKAIAEVLKEEGFIKDYTFTADSKQGMLTVFLKYGPAREKVTRVAIDQIPIESTYLASFDGKAPYLVALTRAALRPTR